MINAVIGHPDHSIISTDTDSTRAWLCKRTGTTPADLALCDLPITPPGPDEVLVRMRSVCANFPDLLMLEGKYQFKPDLPFAPGMEGCGEVVATGDNVRGFTPGQRVAVGARCGLFAEQVNLPAAAVRPAATQLSDSEVAGFQVAFLTAWVALVHRGQLKSGETLLVHGASGGVGMAAVMLARHLGARVLATGRRADKLEVVRDWGADQTILLADRQASNLRDAVFEHTDRQGADLVYDPVGGSVLLQSLRCLKWGGRLLIVGFADGEIPAIPANIPLIKGLSVLGVRAGEIGRRNPDIALAAQQALAELVEAGLKPHICAEIPFESAPLALDLLADRQVVGKVAVVFNA